MGGADWGLFGSRVSSLKPDTARTVDFSGRGRLGPVWGPGIVSEARHRAHGGLQWEGPTGACLGPGVSEARHRAHGGLQWEGPTGACLGPGYWSLKPDTARTVDFSGRGRLGPVWVPGSLKPDTTRTVDFSGRGRLGPVWGPGIVSEARHRAHGGLQWEGPTGACLGPGYRL